MAAYAACIVDLPAELRAFQALPNTTAEIRRDAPAYSTHDQQFSQRKTALVFSSLLFSLQLTCLPGKASRGNGTAAIQQLFFLIIAQEYENASTF